VSLHVLSFYAFSFLFILEGDALGHLLQTSLVGHGSELQSSILDHKQRKVPADTASENHWEEVLNNFLSLPFINPRR